MVGLVRIVSLLLLVVFAAGTSVQASQYAAMAHPLEHAAMAMDDSDMGGAVAAPCKPCQPGLGHNSPSCDGYCVPQAIAASWVAIDLPTFRPAVPVLTFPVMPAGLAPAPSLPPPRTV